MNNKLIIHAIIVCVCDLPELVEKVRLNLNITTVILNIGTSRDIYIIR